MTTDDGCLGTQRGTGQPHQCPSCQPAGEQHTGSLNLTGEGNETTDRLGALHDEISRTYGAIHAPDNLADILARHGWAKVDDTRQQVAEEIAVAIQDEGNWNFVEGEGRARYDSARIAREIGAES